MKPVVLIGYFIGCSLVTATTADAHVKWFVNCNVSDDPLPLYAVFTSTFFQFLALFLFPFFAVCIAERTAFASILSRLLDRCTTPLRGRADEFLRAAAAVTFALLWANGGIILTPELKASSMSLSAIQLLIPIYLFSRATLPAAGAAIIVLYGYGVATYGLFHMLDYPVFVGLGIYFMLSLSRDVHLLAFRFDVLRWTVALSLLWPSMEKFLYPSWVAAIAIVHPELTLGFPVATVVTAAGVVEFGLSFALFWTPLVRRLAALALILVLTAATFDFGKVDGIGHLMIVAVLLVIVADRDGKPQCCRPAVAPLVSSSALLATIFLYAGGHALYYRSNNAAFAPLISGAALLTSIPLCLRGLPRASFQIAAVLWRWAIGGRSGNAQYGSSPRTFPSSALLGPLDLVRPPRKRRTVAGLGVTRLADRISRSVADGDGRHADPAWRLHAASFRPSGLS